jgi:hypothetical protein
MSSGLGQGKVRVMSSGQAKVMVMSSGPRLSMISDKFFWLGVAKVMVTPSGLGFA